MAGLVPAIHVLVHYTLQDYPVRETLKRRQKILELLAFNDVEPGQPRLAASIASIVLLRRNDDVEVTIDSGEPHECALRDFDFDFPWNRIRAINEF